MSPLSLSQAARVLIASIAFDEIAPSLELQLSPAQKTPEPCRDHVASTAPLWQTGLRRVKSTAGVQDQAGSSIRCRMASVGCSNPVSRGGRRNLSTGLGIKRDDGAVALDPDLWG
jgi:hypothetical protein